MKFLVETYGCTMNQGESAELASFLEGIGHERVEDEDIADVAMINTCLVIAPTERKILRRLRQLRDDGKELIVIGCMASVNGGQLRNEFPQALVCGTADYPGLPSELAQKFGTFTSMSPVGTVAPFILPIAQGCNGCCTYCITKLARGDLRSYPLDRLVDDARAALAQGAKEILLTAQDTAAYGMDGEDRLPDLINALTALPGDHRIRIGMMNPDNLKEVIDDLIIAYQSPKVYRFMHLPVQSGSDRIIHEMGRAYGTAEYLDMVRRMRKALPELTLSTDVITGFPRETDDDHRATVELIEALRPNIVNVTRFSARPGTVAESMRDQVVGWRSKERSRELTAQRFRISAEINAAKVGREYSVLIDEKGKGHSVMARTDDYLPVVIKGDHDLWQRVTVRITDSAPTHLYAVIVPNVGN